MSCNINDNTDEIKLKYRSILEYLYKIIKNTNKKLDEGFTYIDDLGVSVQGVESNKCLYEILH